MRLLPSDVTRQLRAVIAVRRRRGVKEPVGEAYRHPVASVLRATSAPATGECITLNTRGPCRTCAVASDQDFKGIVGCPGRWCVILPSTLASR